MSNRRRRARYTLPQECPAKLCGKSLKDESVPAEYRDYQDQFTLAITTTDEDGTRWWNCIHCGHKWLRQRGRRTLPART